MTSQKDPGDSWRNRSGEFFPIDVDTSKLDFPNEIWVAKPLWEALVKSATLLTIVALGLIGNGSLICAVLRARSLQTTTNLLILNMAVADFCVCLLCPVMFLVTDIYQEYVLRELGCKIDGFLPQAMTLVTVFSLSAVSYDRVCAIVLDCTGRLSARNVRMLIGASWLAAFTVTMPLSYFRNYFERVWKNHVERFCGETNTPLPYWHIFVGISVWVPLVIMGVCYSTILIKLDRYETYALKSKHPIVVRYKGRVAKILALVLLSFAVCRLPFTVLVITRAQLKNNEDLPTAAQASVLYVLWFLSRYLIFVNAAINPYLYGCTSGSLRQEMTSYPPLKWIVPAKKSDEVHGRTDCHQQRKRLRPRSPCAKIEPAANRIRIIEKDALPNISSTVMMTQSSKPNDSSSRTKKFYKNFRMSSVVK